MALKEKGVYKFFKFKLSRESSEDQPITGRCKLCNKDISGSLQCSSNFVTHVQRLHNDNTDFKDYELSKSKSRKRKIEDFASTPQPPLKQVLISDYRKPSRHVVDKLIITYIIEDMRPLNTVQSPAFQHLVMGLSPSATIPSQNTLRDRINQEFNNIIAKITFMLENARFACSTADIWSSKKRSFLGMTAHWLDNVTLERRSVAIACKRFRGSHTFDRIAEIINSVHAQFKIENNVLKTITDNGSNFVKAFKIYSNKSEEYEYGSETDENELSDDHEDDLEVIGCADILEKGPEENEMSLTDHLRCCSHTLNLIATTDVKNAMKSKTIHLKAMSKCQVLWNKVSRSTKNADIIQEAISSHLVIPCPTRWNSYYEAVKKLISAETKLNDICKISTLPQFLQQEIQYLKEYIKIMHPLTTALTILEGEKNCYLGLILPTIIKIKESLSGNSSIVASPLKSALLAGIETRFGKYFEDCEFILAAVTHPKFKLSWISDATLKAKASELLYSSVKDQGPSTSIEMTKQDSEDDFFII